MATTSTSSETVTAGHPSSSTARQRRHSRLAGQLSGWRDLLGISVIPLRPFDKRPADDWNRYRTIHASDAELQHWHAQGFGVGLACGKLSRIVVVDCESLDDARWCWRVLGDSPTVVKTRRGYHFYFRYPDGREIGNRAKVPDETGRPRYDVRGEGGYVVAPPTVIRPESDSDWSGEFAYRFAVIAGDVRGLIHPERLPVFDPKWADREWRQPKTRPQFGTQSPNTSERRITDPVAYIRHIRAVSGSRGHDETYRAVCRLRDGGLDANEAFDALREWNQTNADPPWSERELTHKIESVYGKR